MTTKIQYLIFCFVFSSIQVFTQTLSREAITGKWICKEVVYLDNKTISPELMPQLEMTKKAFTNAQFLFGADGIFRLLFPKDIPPVMKQLSFLDNRKWSINSEKRSVLIGTPKENLMEIIVKLGDPTTFFLYETPIALKMEKQ